MARILIADDHPMVRAGLREWLARERSITAIGEAASGDQTLQQMRHAHWDLLVLDINMPNRSGFDIMRHIRSHYPHTRVLVLSGFPEREYAINVLRAGAAGYLSKDRAPEEFVRAVRTVLAGRRYVTRDLAELLVNNLEDGCERAPLAALSERELQMFCKLAAGRTASEIAHELSLSPKTVGHYRARLLDKMKLGRNAEVTAYAVRNGLVQ
jgi:two-component system, NarL family, invasion response regulator UvrY